MSYRVVAAGRRPVERATLQKVIESAKDIAFDLGATVSVFYGELLKYRVTSRGEVLRPGESEHVPRTQA